MEEELPTLEDLAGEEEEDVGDLSLESVSEGDEEEEDSEAEDAVAYSRRETLRAFELTRNWLRDNAEERPQYKRGLLKVARRFCSIEVVVEPAAVVEGLVRLGAVSVSLPGKEAERANSNIELNLTDETQLKEVSIKVDKGRFKRVRDALEQGPASAYQEVMNRVLEELRGRSSQQLPRDMASLLQLVGDKSAVVFDIPPREVLEDLELQDCIAVNDNTDEITYNESRLGVAGKGGLNWASMVLVLLVAMMLAPGLINTLRRWIR